MHIYHVIVFDRPPVGRGGGGSSHRVQQYIRNKKYEPLYPHPQDVPKEVPWEDSISIITLDDFKVHSTKLQNEL